MKPELSVILLAGELRERAARSLSHLLSQTGLPRMEIILVDLNPDLGLPGETGHPAVSVNYWFTPAVGVAIERDG